MANENSFVRFVRNEKPNNKGGRVRPIRKTQTSVKVETANTQLATTAAEIALRLHGAGTGTVSAINGESGEELVINPYLNREALKQNGKDEFSVPFSNVGRLSGLTISSWDSTLRPEQYLKSAEITHFGRTYRTIVDEYTYPLALLWNSATPPVLTENIEVVYVTANASGELIIPGIVSNVKLFGETEGIQTVIKNAHITVSNPGNVKLTIKNLSITAPAQKTGDGISAIKYADDATGTLTLCLNNAALTGGDIGPNPAANSNSAGNGIRMIGGNTVIYPINGVTVTGGANLNTTDKTGNSVGIYGQNITIDGNMTILPGKASINQVGLSLSDGLLTIKKNRQVKMTSTRELGASGLRVNEKARAIIEPGAILTTVGRGGVWLANSSAADGAVLCVQGTLDSSGSSCFNSYEGQCVVDFQHPDATLVLQTGSVREGLKISKSFDTANAYRFVGTGSVSVTSENTMSIAVSASGWTLKLEPVSGQAQGVRGIQKEIIVTEIRNEIERDKTKDLKDLANEKLGQIRK